MKYITCCWCGKRYQGEEDKEGENYCSKKCKIYSEENMQEVLSHTY